MHILHLSAVKNWGGGENHIENLCQELAFSNPEVKNTIFCVKNGTFHKRLQKTDLNFITATMLPKFDPRYFIKLGHICKKLKIDLIHIHDPSAILLAILSDKFYQLPPFVFSKKTSFPIKQRKKTLYKYNYPKIKKVLCVSKETRKIASVGIHDSTKLMTIYHGTNLKTKSTETPFTLRRKYKISQEKMIIGNIANHIRAKHLDTWVDVADTIINKEKRKEFFFIQIGTFTDRTEALKLRVKELGLEEYMIFLGYTPNASNFLPQFDISLLTSQSEGVPQVIYESFYHKTPVISTDVGGIPEIVDHNINGLLAPMHDHDRLSEHIINLTEKPLMQKSFVKNGFEKLTKNFTTTNMAKETLDVYREVTNE
ncbi:glycosyltransferase family 4 protein [Aquimarina sp. RZ0]|uniref:glycosyltransferase family 4 protein n=1 Tax=Aquimarina sp. RZ0 TaxID=2607730 RepID=UPI0011F2607A|nr:glycosyltransferase family 4 protein [Aquimarina sp. RZ0]KAA1247846.1 glycosyltransferase family 4 protein [Aquimarina sp. RZ0]